MKRIIFILVMILLFYCEKSTEPKQNNPKLYLSPDDVTISVGAQSTIDLIIQDCPESFFGLSLQIEYNNSIVSFDDSLGLSTGDFFDSNAIVFVKENSNKIHLTITQIQGQNQVNGSGIVCTITFTGLLVGSSSIQLMENEIHFYNSVGNEIEIPRLMYQHSKINVQ
jgi:hypothetical protein